VGNLNQVMAMAGGGLRGIAGGMQQRQAASMAAEQFQNLGTPEASQFAQQMAQNPRAAMAMAKQFGGLDGMYGMLYKRAQQQKIQQAISQMPSQFPGRQGEARIGAFKYLIDAGVDPTSAGSIAAAMAPNEDYDDDKTIPDWFPKQSSSYDSAAYAKAIEHGSSTGDWIGAASALKQYDAPPAPSNRESLGESDLKKGWVRTKDPSAPGGYRITKAVGTEDPGDAANDELAQRKAEVAKLIEMDQNGVPLSKGQLAKIRTFERMSQITGFERPNIMGNQAPREYEPVTDPTGQTPAPRNRGEIPKKPTADDFDSWDKSTTEKVSKPTRARSFFER